MHRGVARLAPWRPEDDDVRWRWDRPAGSSRIGRPPRLRRAALDGLAHTAAASQRDGCRSIDRMAASTRAFVLRHTAFDRSPGSRRCGSTWPTRCCRSGMPSRSRRRPGRRAAVLGVRLGVGLAIGRYLREHPRSSRAAGCSTSGRAPGCARSPPCTPARPPCQARTSIASRRPRSGSTREPTAAGSRSSGATCWTRRRPRSTSSWPATAGTTPASPSGSCPGCGGRGSAGSTSWSVTLGADTCRPTSWSSSPPTTSHQTELEDSSTSRVGSTPCGGRRVAEPS